MGKEDRRHNKTLEDLLAARAKGEVPGDDFEREALEGFDMLENDAEALSLKNELDAKVSAAIGRKKRPWWTAYAAAASLLIIFSLLFYLARPEDVVVAESRIGEEKLSKVEETGSVAEVAPEPPKDTNKQEEKQKPVIAPQEPVQNRKSEELRNVADLAIAREPEKENKAIAVTDEESLPAPPQKPVETGAANAPAMNEGIALQEVSAKKQKSKKPVAQAEQKRITSDYERSDSTAANFCVFSTGPEKLKQKLSVVLTENELSGSFTALLHINRDGAVWNAEIVKSDGFSRSGKKKLLSLLLKLDNFTCAGNPEGSYMLNYERESSR